jgi:hypothetical protein
LVHATSNSAASVASPHLSAARIALNRRVYDESVGGVRHDEVIAVWRSPERHPVQGRVGNLELTDIGPFLNQYAGQQLLTGAQAEAYADHFIAVHLKAIGGGLTYAQLNTKAKAAPTDTKLAGTVETMFKGETLRGLLLNAYAFGTVSVIAGIAAICAFIGAVIMLILSLLGFSHLRRVPADEELGAHAPPAHA